VAACWSKASRKLGQRLSHDPIALWEVKHGRIFADRHGRVGLRWGRNGPRLGTVQSAVSVAGTFNQWNPQAAPLAREDNGYWSTDVPGAELGNH
jgi:hypothetical protein